MLVGIFALLGFVAVPLGEKTGYEHLRSVLATDEAQRAIDEMGDASIAVRQKVKGMINEAAAPQGSSDAERGSRHSGRGPDDAERTLGETGKALGETGRSLGETGRTLGEAGRELGETGRSLRSRLGLRRARSAESER